MILAVLASDGQKKEIAASAFFKKHEVVFSENVSLWAHHAADSYLDLLFEPDEERIRFLARLLPKPVIVHSVTNTLDALHPGFIRINAWPGFLKGKTLEASASPEVQRKAALLFGEDLIFVKDLPGFVSARIVAMILNEAFLTWEAGTASKKDIDLAMKLGTGYPYGPFEWTEMIGVGEVAGLLTRLSIERDEIAKSLGKV